MFVDLSYSRKSHIDRYSDLGKSLRHDFWGVPFSLSDCYSKHVQDIITLHFLEEHIPAGSRILEVGGGNSRMLKHCAKKYECWNVDKMEGVGCGPTSYAEIGYHKLVLDYMGCFNRELPDNYFDFIFSISALEHTPHEKESMKNITEDMRRVLKPGAWCFHLIDCAIREDGSFRWKHPLIDYFYDIEQPLTRNFTGAEILEDDDAFFLSEALYMKTWWRNCKMNYTEFGRPTSINVLWKKEP
jgi:hypothetical protein